MVKQHSRVEIAAKLRQADAWRAAGKLHCDIAKALGISVMTYYRWRRREPAQAQERAPASRRGVLPQESRQEAERSPTAELRLENSRLRQLVADLLLENMQLQEALRDGTPGAETQVRHALRVGAV
jgi:putative transposase